MEKLCWKHVSLDKIFHYPLLSFSVIHLPQPYLGSRSGFFTFVCEEQKIFDRRFWKLVTPTRCCPGNKVREPATWANGQKQEREAAKSYPYWVSQPSNCVKKRTSQCLWKMEKLFLQVTANVSEMSNLLMVGKLLTVNMWGAKNWDQARREIEE